MDLFYTDICYIWPIVIYIIVIYVWYFRCITCVEYEYYTCIFYAYIIFVFLDLRYMCTIYICITHAGIDMYYKCQNYMCNTPKINYTSDERLSTIWERFVVTWGGLSSPILLYTINCCFKYMETPPLFY